MLGLQSMLIVGALSLVLAGGGYFYFDYTQDKMQEQAARIVAMDSALKQQEETINQMLTERDATAAAMGRYAMRARIAEQYQDDLLNVLHKHDLTNLVSKKPGLTGKAINEGTDKVFSDLERLTQPE